MTENFSCIEIKSILSAYFDEELSFQEKLIVKNHLLQCPECEKELENIKNLSAVLKNYSKKTDSSCPDLNLSEKIVSRLDVCNEISGDLSAFMDGETPKGHFVKICDHLLKCKYCRNDYEILKFTKKAIKNYFKRSTEEFKLPNESFKEIILNKIMFIQRQRKIVYSAVALGFLVAASYFSVSLVNFNYPEKETIHEVKLTKDKSILTPVLPGYKNFTKELKNEK